MEGVGVFRLLGGVAGERQSCLGCFCEGEVHKGVPNLRVDLQCRLKGRCTFVGQFPPCLGQVEVSIGKRVSGRALSVELVSRVSVLAVCSFEIRVGLVVDQDGLMFGLAASPREQSEHSFAFRFVISLATLLKGQLTNRLDSRIEQGRAALVAVSLLAASSGNMSCKVKGQVTYHLVRNLSLQLVQSAELSSHLRLLVRVSQKAGTRMLLRHINQVCVHFWD